MKTATYLKSKLRKHGITGADDIDPKFFNMVAQIAHFGAMYTVTNIFSVVSHRLIHHRWGGLIFGMAACVSYATWHEFFWDPCTRTPRREAATWKTLFFSLSGR